MFKPIFLLIALSSVVSIAQEPPSYDLNGLEKLKLASAMKPENYERGRSGWEKAGNPRMYLTAGECKRLLESSVVFSVHCETKSAIIDDVGIRVTSPLYRNRKQFWEKLLATIEKETSEAVPTDFCELLLKVQEYVTSGSEKNEYPITMFAKYYEHYSVVRKKKEKWLLLEFASFQKELPIYDRSLLYSHSTNSGKVELITIHPYPDDGEAAALIAELVEKPLKPDRNQIRTSDAYGIRPPTPIVDDGLTQNARELIHQFVVRDQQSFDSYQIESTEMSIDQPSTRYDLKLAERDFGLDFPAGRVMTFDEIHRTCGEFAKREQAKAKSLGDNIILVFEIQPYEHGKYTYSKIRLDIVPIEGD